MWGSFDLVLLDYMMPGLDGVQLTAMLRGKGFEGPILILSSNGERKSKDVAVDRWLNKPLKQKSLVDAIVACLPEASTGTQFPDPTFASQYPFTIGLTESNVLNRKLVLRLLRELGYQVALFEDNQALLDALDQQDLDVLFVDLHMPGLSGTVVSQHIRASMEASRQPAIIGLTSVDNESNRAAAREAGINDLLNKPVDPGTLIRMLKQMAQFEGETVR